MKRNLMKQITDRENKLYKQGFTFIKKLDDKYCVVKIDDEEAPYMIVYDSDKKMFGEKTPKEGDDYVVVEKDNKRSLREVIKTS